MTQVHPKINIGLQYIRNTSEIHSEVTYTSTLPLNKEGILSTQFSAQVFFFVASGSSSSPHHLHLQVIFIFKSSSSLDLDHHWIWIITGHHHWIWIITGHHHWIWIITGHHHWIWIITRSRSSLLDHHHWIWIITRSGSSLGHHHWCYLLILLVIGSSIDPTLFHAGCRPSLHVGLLQLLYLTLS